MESNLLLKIRDKYLLVSAFFLLGVFIALQLYLLTSVGTKGQELSNIRQEQSEIKVENEILKARILELRSNQVVLNGLEARAEVEPKKISVIDPAAFNVAAQN